MRLESLLITSEAVSLCSHTAEESGYRYAPYFLELCFSRTLKVDQCRYKGNDEIDFLSWLEVTGSDPRVTMTSTIFLFPVYQYRRSSDQASLNTFFLDEQEKINYEKTKLNDIRPLF